MCAGGSEGPEGNYQSKAWGGVLQGKGGAGLDPLTEEEESPWIGTWPTSLAHNLCQAESPRV